CLDPGARLDPACAELGSLAQSVARLHRLAGRGQCNAELAEKLETLRVSLREQRRRATTQPNGGSCVAALPGCDAGGAEMTTRVLGDLRRASVICRQQLGRLLEMEADDLVGGAARFEQIGRRLVQARAVGPRDGGVRRLVDERMPKTETLFEHGGRRRGIEQAAANERCKRLTRAVRVQELGDDLVVELTTDDRGALDRSAFDRREPV